MSGNFSPAARLGEERLAELYGVSRTPVREALARLLADGLVQRGEHGLYPYRPRLDELGALYELRITLELRGIDRVREGAALRHDRTLLIPELGRWTAARDTPPAPAEFVGRDEHFHLLLLDSSGNHALTEALSAVNARIRPVRMFDDITADRLTTTIAEHIHIAELVLAGDLEHARDALRSHIADSRDVVIERAEQALALSRIAAAVRD